MRLMKYLGAVGLAIFIALIWAIGPQKILESLVLLDPATFTAAMLLLIPLVAIKACKQRLLVSAFGVRLGLLDSAKIWLAGFFLGVVSPGKAGELFRCVYLGRKCSVPTGKCLTAVVLERAFDVAMLFVFSITGLFFFSFYFLGEVQLVLILVLLFALFIAAAMLFTRKGLVAALLRPLFRLLVPAFAKEKLRRSFHEFYNGLALYMEKRALLARVLLWTAVSWLFGLFQVYVVALALRIDISYIFVLTVMPVVLLLSTLPIAFSGIGTRDLALVFFLSFLSIGPGAAISLSLAMLLSDLLLSAAGLLFLQSMPKKGQSMPEQGQSEGQGIPGDKGGRT